MVWAEETVALGKALQRCNVHSKMPLGVLCRAVQELCKCLTSVIQSGDLVDLEILEVAEKDPVTHTSAWRTPSLIQRVEPLVSVTVPSELSASDPGEAAPPEELTLVLRQSPLLPPCFYLSWADGSDSLPPEQVDWPLSKPPGAQLDFASLESHTGDYFTYSCNRWVHCKYQSWTIALMSLTMVPLQSDPSDCEVL